jgi:hypothetical protein
MAPKVRNSIGFILTRREMQEFYFGPITFSQLYGYNAFGNIVQSAFVSYNPAFLGLSQGNINISENEIYTSEDSTLPISITKPFTYNVRSNDGVYSYIQLARPNDTVSTYAYAGLTTLTYTFAVPEPSTWAMMLLGFAGVGFAGYRRPGAGRATLAA